MRKKLFIYLISLIFLFPIYLMKDFQELALLTLFIVNIYFPLKKVKQNFENKYYLNDEFILSFISIIYFFTSSTKFLAVLFLLIYNITYTFINKMYIKIYKNFNNYLKSEVEIKVLVNNKIRTKKLINLKKKDIVIYERGDLIYTEDKNHSYLSKAEEYVEIKSSYDYKDLIENEVYRNLNEHIKDENYKQTNKFSHFITLFNVVVFLIVFLINFYKTSNYNNSLRLALNYLMFSIFSFTTTNYIITIYSYLIHLYKQNIIVNSSNVLDKVLKADSIILDKSKVLLDDNLKIIKENPKGIVNIMAALEKNLNNPIAKVLKENKTEDIEFKIDKTIKNNSSYEFIVGKDTYLLGSADFIHENNINFPYEYDAATNLYLVKNNEYQGFISIKSDMKKHLKEDLEELRKYLKHIIVLSGDNFEYVSEICNELKIDRYMASVSKNDKYTYLKKAKEENNKIIFVGDYKDDKKILKEAYLSVSMGNIINKDVDLIILEEDLGKINYFIKVAKSFKRVIFLNQITLLVFKLLILALIASGLFHLIIGLIINEIIILMSALNGINILERKKNGRI